MKDPLADTIRRNEYRTYLRSCKMTRASRIHPGWVRGATIERRYGWDTVMKFKLLDDGEYISESSRSLWHFLAVDDDGRKHDLVPMARDRAI